MFSTDRLRALAAVAEHGSIAAAARVLHVTPSGVSQQLARLEREAGRPLLEPDGRTVRLTQAGRVLAGHAARVGAQLEQARADLDDLGEEVLGPLRLGGVGTALRTLVPPALAALLAGHPRVEPSVGDGEAVALLPRLMRGELDLVVVESWSPRPLALPAGAAVERLVREEVRVALAGRHPLAERARVRLEELADESWASCPTGTEPYESLVQVARASGFDPRIPYTLTEMPTQLELVRSGLAVALVPETARYPETPGVRFVPVEQGLHRDITAVWREGADDPPVRAFLEAIRTGAGRLTSGGSETAWS
ncbi:LysR family transcriptional regulator [Nocardiopsis baichengensis]|uniref:LysR family transcriptional regulator n=1 Tax=Nocardiopsis baichengensis TaxID=280240 RepID=UPI00034796F5|nr:LysR family transcriptional regulator [Nocardiopsis baichengensis]